MANEQFSSATLAELPLLDERAIPEGVNYAELEAKQDTLVNLFAQAVKNVRTLTLYGMSTNMKNPSPEVKDAYVERLQEQINKQDRISTQIESNKLLLDMHDSTRRKANEKQKLLQEELKTADSLSRSVGVTIGLNRALVFSEGVDPMDFWNAFESFIVTNYSQNVSKAATAALKISCVGHPHAQVWLTKLSTGALLPEDYDILELKNQFMLQVIGPLWNGGDQNAIFSVYYGHQGAISFSDRLETNVRYTNTDLEDIFEAKTQLKNSIFYKIPEAIRSDGGSPLKNASSAREMIDIIRKHEGVPTATKRGLEMVLAPKRSKITLESGETTDKVMLTEMLDLKWVSPAGKIKSTTQNF